MPALVSKKFRLHNAKQFSEAFDEDTGFTTFANTSAGDTSLETNMYLFIGGVSAWSDDSNPPTPTDSVANSYYSHWRDMIAAKKVSSTDVTHCVARNNWTNNIPYFAYSDANNALYDQSFFVMTDEYNVYKCLANNDSAGSSVAKPTGTGTSIITPGADGYKWKFMYTVSASKALKFATTSYIPVQQVRNANAFGKTGSTGMPSSTQENEKQRAVEVAAVDGAINIFQKTANGTGYYFHQGDVASVTNTTTVTLDTSASTTADIYTGMDLYFTNGDAAGMGGTITDYTTGRIVTLGTALGATPVAGDDFIVAPKVAITGDGQSANARANGSNTAQITDIVTIAAGASYSNAVVTITSNTSHGSGATGIGIIEPKLGHGYDAIEELGGFNVMINSRLENDESGAFTVNNDFRKIGLVSNPLFANGDLATSTTADQAVTITVQSYSQSSATYAADQLVTGSVSGATGRVVDFSSNTTLRLVSVTHGTNATAGYDSIPGSFQTNESLTVSGGDPTSNTSAVSSGALKAFSGDIIYVENRSPVTRASDQIEDVKLIINF
jgi:hypothetical protein